MKLLVKGLLWGVTTVCVLAGLVDLGMHAPSVQGWVKDRLVAHAAARDLTLAVTGRTHAHLLPVPHVQTDGLTVANRAGQQLLAAEHASFRLSWAHGLTLQPASAAPERFATFDKPGALHWHPL